MDTLYSLLFLFFLYSFLGWCLEVTYRAVTSGVFVNRGFLNGPVCPIYGAGALVILTLLTPIAENPLLLFLASVVLTSLLELAVGYLLNLLFHASWWDYSREPFNLGGYICLRFSLLWGIACVIVVNIIHPMILALIGLIPTVLGWIFLTGCSAVITADLVVTVACVRKMFCQLDSLHLIADEIHGFSDRLGEQISETAINAKELTERLSDETEQLGDDLRDRLESRLDEFREEHLGSQEEIKAKAKELQQQFRRKLSETSFGQARLLKAFPQLSSQRYPEMLEKLRDFQLRKK